MGSHTPVKGIPNVRRPRGVLAVPVGQQTSVEQRRFGSCGVGVERGYANLCMKSVRLYEVVG